MPSAVISLPSPVSKKTHIESVLCLCLGLIALLSQTLWGQIVPELRLDFKSRTLEFRIQVKDLQYAYRVTSTGGIQMLPTPKSELLVDEKLTLRLEQGPEETGRLSIDRGGSSYEVLLRVDNGLAERTLVTGLPFGYEFLPREAKANVGESWIQEFPITEAGDGLLLHVAYKYTLISGKGGADCSFCALIQIEGRRRFLPGPSLDEALTELPTTRSSDFYSADRTFAVGTFLFDRKERFLRRFELSANTSLLTLIPIPGLMRQIILEDLSAAD